MEEVNLLLNSIIDGIQEKKGKKITKIKLAGIPGVVCDYFVICEGNSPTQVSSIAESVEATVKMQMKESPLRVQGYQYSEWIGLDYGDVIVHVFLPEKRSYYNLDHLWDDAPSERILSID